MEMIITGSGTSHGIPVIGCSCPVCTSDDKNDKRLRCSAWLRSPVSVIIDTGPEFRMQALEYKINNADGVLITHGHADHLNGLDDVRVFSHTKSVDPNRCDGFSNETKGEGLSVYANSFAAVDIHKRFDYVFVPVKEGGGKPKIALKDTAAYSDRNPIFIGEVKVIPVPMWHGSLETCGFLMVHNNRSIAYLTDCNYIPVSSLELIRRNCGVLEHVIVDGLREKIHSTHFSFRQAMEVAEYLEPEHTWLTHITHEMKHAEIQSYINSVLGEFPNLRKIVEGGGSVAPAYDGLVIGT